MLHRFVLVLMLPVLATAQTAEPVVEESPSFAQRDQRYRLQPNDVVEVHFRYTPEYNLTATIQPDGYLTSQIAGDVKVGGLTLAEAADRIAEKASTRLNAPEVVVIPKDFVKPRFSISGEVNNPGYKEIRGEVGLLEAIGLGGGFKDSAKRKQVVLVRNIDSEYARVHVFDVKKLMQPKNISERILVQPDDVIVVPKNRISKIEPVARIASLSFYGLSLALTR